MRKSITLLLLMALFASCSVYEDVTFRDNGSIFYKFTVDAGEMIGLAGSTSGTNSDMISSGETISIAEMIRDSIGDITPEIEADLQNIAPFYMSYIEDVENKVADLSYFGEFESADKYNKAIASIKNLVQQDYFAHDGADLTFLFLRNNFTWDGKTMTRYTEDLAWDSEDMDDDREELASDWGEFFGSGKIIVKYHFPREVESSTDNEALLSMDKKTVVLNPPTSTFFKLGKLLDITIQVEN